MPVVNCVREKRLARGISATALARDVGVSRQTIYSIEDSSFVPNTVISLRLASALGVTVEQLFSEKSAGVPDHIEKAQLLRTPGANTTQEEYVRLCRVRGKLVAISAAQVPAFLPPVDGRIQGHNGSRVVVRFPQDLPATDRALVLAGCDPALSLLNGSLHHPGTEMIPVACASRTALDWLKQGRIHAAGSHLRDAASGEYNLPILKRLFGSSSLKAGSLAVVHFAAWEQGLVVARGNPKRIHTVEDLARKNLKIVNRQKGSGSRDLLDSELDKIGLGPGRVAGYEKLAESHLAAAQLVALGIVDACIANCAAARCFGLSFIPLCLERFDLVFAKDAMEMPTAQALLDLLSRGTLRRKLETLAGYDTAQTGKRLH